MDFLVLSTTDEVVVGIANKTKDDLVKNYKNCHFEIYYILYILARCFLGENCSLLVTAFILYMDVCKADVRFHLTQPLFDW